jgi:MarR family transcriptional regulator, organic hydroperoxide resistance regulator
VKKTGESALQREIQQRRPFRTAAEEAVLGLFRTADQARRLLTAEVDAHGITLQQYNVLRILRGAGEAGLPTLEIAARMIEQAPGVTRLLDRMEAKALVRRARHAEDRRQVLCFITPAGLHLLSLLDEPMHDAARRVMAPLKEADTRVLIRLMDSLRPRDGSTSGDPKDVE